VILEGQVTRGANREHANYCEGQQRCLKFPAAVRNSFAATQCCTFQFGCGHATNVCPQTGMSGEHGNVSVTALLIHVVESGRVSSHRHPPRSLKISDVGNRSPSVSAGKTEKPQYPAETVCRPLMVFISLMPIANRRKSRREWKLWIIYSVRRNASCNSNYGGR